MHCLRYAAKRSPAQHTSARVIPQATRPEQPTAQQQKRTGSKKSKATTHGSANKPVMQAMSMPKKQQKANAPVPTANKAKSPIKSSTPSVVLTDLPDPWGPESGYDPGLGRYELRRRKAEAAGKHYWRLHLMMYIIKLVWLMPKSAPKTIISHYVLIAATFTCTVA